jgi:hypothetical protein
MLESRHNADERATPYASSVDFCEIFTAEMNSLYLLAFVLTGDNDKAEQCFVSALGECLEESGPFMEWALSCARHTILKQAIRMMMPTPDSLDQLSFVSLHREASTGGKYNATGAIVGLGTFERFVFVMSVLEKKSDEDCSSLLRCSRREITIARELAFRCLTTAGAHYEQAVNSSRWES